MKIFISWSGETSQKYAKFLKDWIEQCIQSAEVFFSAEDIEKGEHWHERLSTELKDSSFGIICLTSENINAPWIHFEAGALAKMLDSRVATLAININYFDIKGPLSSFQATKLDREDILKLLKSINMAQEKPLDEKKLEASFAAFWPQFQEMINNTQTEISKTGKEKSAKKDEMRESIDELLQLVRNQNSLLVDLRHISINGWGDPQRVDDIFEAIFDCMSTTLTRSGSLELLEEYRRLSEKIAYKNPLWFSRFRHLLWKRPGLRRKEGNNSGNDE